MSLVLYDTKSRAKREFVPIRPGRAGMYVCGPTVYDRAHIGNARPVIVFDVLYRLLKRIYGEGHVTYVRNITDIDDKINAASIETGEPIAELHKAVDDVFAAQPDDDRGALKGRLGLMAGFLGLLRNQPATWFKGAADDVNVVGIEQKIAAREAARRAKDFAEADRIREELEDQGILLEDGPGGTTWRRAG